MLADKLYKKITIGLVWGLLMLTSIIELSIQVIIDKQRHA